MAEGVIRKNSRSLTIEGFREIGTKGVERLVLNKDLGNPGGLVVLLGNGGSAMDSVMDALSSWPEMSAGLDDASPGTEDYPRIEMEIADAEGESTVLECLDTEYHTLFVDFLIDLFASEFYDCDFDFTDLLEIGLDLDDGTYEHDPADDGIFLKLRKLLKSDIKEREALERSIIDLANILEASAGDMGRKKRAKVDRLRTECPKESSICPDDYISLLLDSEYFGTIFEECGLFDDDDIEELYEMMLSEWDFCPCCAERAAYKIVDLLDLVLWYTDIIIRMEKDLRKALKHMLDQPDQHSIDMLYDSLCAPIEWMGSSIADIPVEVGENNVYSMVYDSEIVGMEPGAEYAGGSLFDAVMDAVDIDPWLMSPDDEDLEEMLDDDVLYLPEDLDERLVSLAEDFNSFYGLSGYGFAVEYEGETARIVVTKDGKELDLETEPDPFNWKLDYFLGFFRRVHAPGEICVLDPLFGGMTPQEVREMLPRVRDYAEENSVTFILSVAEPYSVGLDYPEELRFVITDGDNVTIVNDFEGFEGPEMEPVRYMERLLRMDI